MKYLRNKKNKENFEKSIYSKFSKKNFAQISSRIKILDTFKIFDFEVFGNLNYAKFSKKGVGMVGDTFVKIVIGILILLFVVGGLYVILSKDLFGIARMLKNIFSFG